MKGKMEDLTGRMERQAGEWTGDKKMQTEGMTHQIKGKVRNAVGQVKDAARDAMHNRDVETEKTDRDTDRDIDGRRELHSLLAPREAKKAFFGTPFLFYDVFGLELGPPDAREEL